MKSRHAALTAAAMAIAIVGSAHAGPERVAFPAGYQTEFVRYATVDRDGRSITRFLYVDRPSLEAARAGGPLPNGATLVMEDHNVRVVGETPVRDADGRYIPTDDVTNVFVMQKGAGWGDAYPADVRNGDWEYAWFTAAGAPRTDKSMDGCFACHKKQAGEDFTFSFSPFIEKR